MSENSLVGVSRRGLLKVGLWGGAGLALSPALGACGGGGGGTKLSVLSYGGPVQDLQKELLREEMKKNHDVTVSVNSTGTVMAPQVAAQLPNPKYDLFTENFLLYPTTEKAWTEIDFSKLSNADRLYPKLREYFMGVGVPAWMQSQTIVYNSDDFDGAPTLDDLTKPEYKGRISLQGTPATMYIAPTIMAWTGATLENEKPMWDWVEAVAPNIVTNYTQPTQPVQMFQSGEISAALWYTGRAAELAATTDVPVKWVSENATGVIIGFAIPPGTETVEEAHQYIDAWLDPDVQGKMAEGAFFGPVITDAALSADAEKSVPVNGQEEIDKLILPDWSKISPKLKKWQAKFDAILAEQQ